MSTPLKILSLFIFLMLSSCHGCQLKKDKIQATNNWQEVIDYANKNLPHEGRLVQQEDGYAYIKVDDAYIHELFPLLKVQAQGFKKPPYFRRDNAPGAHISVFYENENIKVKEAGQSFAFTLADIVMVQVNKSVSYIILQLHAPALENLRKSYGLKAKLKGHEFHISIAKKQT